MEHWLYFFKSSSYFVKPTEAQWDAVIDDYNYHGPTPAATEDHSGLMGLSAAYAGNPADGDYIWFRFYSVKYGEGSWSDYDDCQLLHYDID